MPSQAEALLLAAQLAQIQAIISSGLERGSYDGKSTDFRSLQELYKIRDDLQAQLGLNRRVSRTAVAYSGGF